MATDKSEPRVGLIINVGLISVCTVVAVRIALGSYFDQVAQAEMSRKIGQAKPEALMELRTDEHARLMGGPMPIAQAMETLAKKGRSMTAIPEIAPTVSHDMSPLQGWTKMPIDVPAPMMAAAASASAAAAATPEAPAADGGVAPAAAPDAGANATPSNAKPADAGAGKKKQP
jgi:hypothetical protein